MPRHGSSQVHRLPPVRLEELEGRLLLSGLDELPGTLVPPSSGYRPLLLGRNGDLVLIDADLATGSELDYYVLRPESGGAYTLAATGGINTVMGLYSATGTLIASNDDRAAGDANAEVSANLDGGTVYWLAVTGNGASFGAYGLAITGPDQALAATVRTDPPSFSRVAIGSVSPQFDVDYWAIVAPDGAASLSLSLDKGSTGSIDGYLRLEDSSGSVLGQANAAGVGASEKLDSVAVTGGQTYYATVAGWAGSSGAYSLTSTFVVRCTVQSVDVTLNPDDSQSVETGGVVAGSGTIHGSGWGTVQYRWAVQKPGGAVWTSQVFSTLLSGGSAAVPTFSGLPTTDSGLHKAWIRIEGAGGPDDTLSQQKTYAVNMPTVTFSGTATYRDGTAEGAACKPLRNVEVNLLDINYNVVATTRTAADGAFAFPAFSAESGSQFRLRVVARSSAAEVRDGAAVYEFLSPFQTVHASGGYTLSAQIEPSAGAGAWNILDEIISARDYLLAGGLVTASEIDGAVVTWTPAGTSEAVTAQEASIVGGMEFSDGVVLHQYGHYVGARMGFANDSPGGPHYVNKPAAFAQPGISGYQGEALAFAEGWASFFSSVALFSQGRSGGAVAVPAANVQGTVADAYAVVNPEDGNLYTLAGDRTSLATYVDVTGSDSELAVWGVLWDLFDQDSDEVQGLDAVWADSPLANPVGKPAGWASDPFSVSGAFGTVWNVLVASRAKTISEFWNAWLDASVSPTTWPGRSQSTEQAWRVFASREVGVAINDGSSPSAAIANPSTGAIVNQDQINARGYIDVDFSDTGGSGLDHASIVDAAAELALTGAGASGVVIDGAPMLVSGTTGTYRYSFTGSFGVGVIQVGFVGGSWSDNAGNPGFAAGASFTVGPSQPIVSYSVTFTDLSGAAITAIRAGQEFQAVVWVDDLRGTGASGGVRGGYVDLECDAAVQWVAGSIVYGGGFTNAPSGLVSPDGTVVDEAGAARSEQLSPPGDSAQVLFTVTGRAASSIAPAAVNFRLGPADDSPAHDTWLYGFSEALPVVAITYGNGRLDVLSTYHNGVRPGDVNDNGTVEPQDALILVNKINTESPHLLAPPQDAYPAAGTGMYWDVNADDYITPLDALNVINEINGAYASAAPAPPAPSETVRRISLAAAAPPSGAVSWVSLAALAPPAYTVRYILSVTDLSGVAISSIQAGGDFQLRCYVQDLRTSPQGVFAGYADVVYAGPAQTSGGFTYGSEYPNGHSGSAATAGLLDEVGGFDGFTPTDGLPHLLFTMGFHASSAGTVTFNADPADVTPAHQTLVFGSNTAVSTGEIEFAQTSILVTASQPALTLAVAPGSFSEAAGALAATGTVTRTGPTDASLVVNLVSGDTSEATVPTSVTIPAGQASADFTIAAVDDSLVDGMQQVTFTAVAGGFVSGACQVSVTDNDVAVVLAISLSIQPSGFSEAVGASAATGTVTRTGPTGSSLVVNLASGDTSEATVPVNVTIPAGQASADFAVAAVDDTLVDGTQQVTITASAVGFTSGSQQVSVTDNDVAVQLGLSLSIQPSSFSEAAGASAATGTVTRTGPTGSSLVVNLASGDTSEATVPASVTIPAGQASADFTVAAVDDALVDGTQQVTITASAVGFTSGSRQVGVTDNDVASPGDDYADPGQWSQAGEVHIDPGSGEGQASGQIEEPSDGDLLKFVAAQDGVARIVVSPSAGNINPTVTVYDAAGNPVACNDRDPGAGFRAWVDLQAGETCYVEVQGGGGSGAYQVAIDTTPTASFRLGKSAGLPATGYFSGSGGGIVTVSYAGAGLAEIFTAAGGGGIEAVAVRGATTGSSLTIKTKSGAGHVTLGDVFVDGAIKGITAATSDLAGRLEIDGSLGKLTLSDVSNSEIHIGPRSAGDARTETGIILGRVKDLRIVSDTPIKSIRAVEWLDTDSTEDIIQAPSVGAVTITGRKANAKSGQTALAGDLAAGMILSDATRKQTLGAAKVAGSILKGSWRVAGNVGAISAKATSSAWSLYAGGSLNRLDSLGDLAGTVSATRIGAVGAKAALTASLSAGATDAKGASLGVLKAGTVHNASVVSTGGVGKVLASCWEGGSISAGWIGSIKTSANARLGGDGGFDGDIALSGLWTPAGKAALGSATVAGNLGGQWSLAGSLGSLKVLGSADHARVQAAGAIGSIALGASDGSDFLVGVGGDKRHAESPADFASAGRIGAFKVTGLKMPSGTPMPRFVTDTNISAATIGTVALVNAESTGNGIYVRWIATGGEIASVVAKDTQYPENNWSYPPEGLFTGPDILHFL